MTNYLNIPLPFTDKKPKKAIIVEVVKESSYNAWLKKQDAASKTQIEHSGFVPGQKSALISRAPDGDIAQIFALIKDQPDVYDICGAVDHIKAQLSQDFLKKHIFQIQAAGLSPKQLESLATGWGLSSYQFVSLKSKANAYVPILLWPDKVDKARVTAFLRSIFLLRTLINLPTNELGPAQLENAVRQVAKEAKATVKVTTDKKLLDNNFPLIHAVGDAAAADRRPRLIDLRWGKKTDPKVTLVGKGVCFDTGGLDLKPSAFMKLMKKDMGGAAHALALAWIIMTLKLPVQLRLLIPAVENAVSGAAFRPGDIFKSRKGHYVENTNTDAEGRLVLADALTYACEDKPELVIDFATLTGSARAALGEDIPALFSNNEKSAQALQKLSFELNDPLWNMPLWQPYLRLVQSSTGDMVNSVATPGDLIYSALFLQQFLDNNPEWIHLDLFAWESAGRPGRAKGGCDMGIRTLLAFLEKRYG